MRVFLSLVYQWIPLALKVNFCQNVDTRGCTFSFMSWMWHFMFETNMNKSEKQRMQKVGTPYVRCLKNERSLNLIRTSFRAGSENMCIVPCNAQFGALHIRTIKGSTFSFFLSRPIQITCLIPMQLAHLTLARRILWMEKALTLKWRRLKCGVRICKWKNVRKFFCPSLFSFTLLFYLLLHLQIEIHNNGFWRGTVFLYRWYILTIVWSTGCLVQAHPLQLLPLLC